MAKTATNLPLKAEVSHGQEELVVLRALLEHTLLTSLPPSSLSLSPPLFQVRTDVLTTDI